MDRYFFRDADIFIKMRMVERNYWRKGSINRARSFYRNILSGNISMSFSISPSVAFSGIHWDTLQNRPPIDKSMRFCREKDWYRDAKCCMSGYTIEHVRDMAYDHGNQGMPEALFLDGYPCLNGRELDSLVAKVTSKTSGIDIFQGPLLRLFERLFSNSLETALMTPLRGFGPE